MLDLNPMTHVIGGYQSRIEMVPGLESEWVALSRDYETTQKMYTELLAKSEDSKVAANLERRQIGEQFRVLDPARLPEKPVSPNRLRINGIGLALGLGLGLGIGVLLSVHAKAVGLVLGALLGGAEPGWWALEREVVPYTYSQYPFFLLLQGDHHAFQRVFFLQVALYGAVALLLSATRPHWPRVLLVGASPMRARIVRAVRLVSPLPLTVKIRAGWSPTHGKTLDLASALENSGADAVTVHPRFVKKPVMVFPGCLVIFSETTYRLQGTSGFIGLERGRDHVPQNRGYALALLLGDDPQVFILPVFYDDLCPMHFETP